MQDKTIIYAQVYQIINSFSKNEQHKIPIEILNFIKENMDSTYVLNIKNNEPPELLMDAKAILYNLYRDYWATPDTKQEMLLNENVMRKKYSELFNSRNIFENFDKEKKPNNSLVLKKEKGFFTKIFNKIQQIFKSFFK